MSRNCGRCHTCGAKLQSVQDGEEWCPSCSAYRRYPSHGWAYSRTADRDTQCPTWVQDESEPEALFEEALRGGVGADEAARLADWAVASRVLRKRLGRQPTEAEVLAEIRRM